MIIALAPRMPRGCSWVWPSIVLLSAFPLALQAQSSAPAEEGTAKKAEAPKEATKPAAAAARPGDEPEAASKKADETEKKADAAEKKADADETAPTEDAKAASSVEFFVDPNATEANQINFPQLPTTAFNTRQIRDVEAMAKGGRLDRDLVVKYVNKYAADLTKHSFIKALVEPDPDMNPNSADAIGFREASSNLANPIDLAKRANNTAFLKVYTEALLSLAPKLLKNHLLTRIETAILLGKTGSPEAIETFIAQLKDSEQTIWVKVWAARGLLNILQVPAGYQDLPGGTTVIAKAAHALVDLLADKTLPWPAQLRALETLGALRMAADPRAQNKLEMASSAMELLADPKVRLEVRAQAAWTLGMMRVSQANSKFNYKLVAHRAGEVAAELGDKIGAAYGTNFTLAQSYAAPLLYQIYPAFYGVEGARESGLLRMPSLGQNRAYVDQVATLIKPVAQSAVELFKAPKGNRDKVAKTLSDRVVALKTFLDKNVPEDTQFGEKQFPLKGEIAGAAVEGEPAVVGAVRGR